MKKMLGCCQSIHSGAVLSLQSSNGLEIVGGVGKLQRRPRFSCRRSKTPECREEMWTASAQILLPGMLWNLGFEQAFKMSVNDSDAL